MIGAGGGPYMQDTETKVGSLVRVKCGKDEAVVGAWDSWSRNCFRLDTTLGSDGDFH